MRKLGWILAAFMSLTVATTAWAGDDVQAKSGGFFAFFRNLFHSSDSPAPRNSEVSQDNGAAAQGLKKTKFIYLDDGSSPSDDSLLFGSMPMRLHAAPFTIHKKDSLTPNPLFERDGLSSLVHSPAPATRNTQKAGARLNMSFPTADRKNPLSDLDISLISRVAVQSTDDNTLTSGGGYNGLYDRRAYALGLNVDYRGFYAGADYGKQQDGLTVGYHGYDVGFGYQGHKWSTGVQFSGYRKDNNTMGLIGPDGIRSVQVGASYSMWPWITFSGQFHYYDYSGAHDLLLDQTRVFTLGTSLNF